MSGLACDIQNSLSTFGQKPPRHSFCLCFQDQGSNPKTRATLFFGPDLVFEHGAKPADCCCFSCCWCGQKIREIKQQLVSQILNFDVFHGSCVRSQRFLRILILRVVGPPFLNRVWSSGCDPRHQELSAPESDPRILPKGSFALGAFLLVVEDTWLPTLVGTSLSVMFALPVK